MKQRDKALSDSNPTPLPKAKSKGQDGTHPGSLGSQMEMGKCQES